MPNQKEEPLQELRDEINVFDQRILQLLNDRAKIATKIAKIKHQTTPEQHSYRPEREAQVLRQIIAANHGPLSDNVISNLFREIMSACLALEQPLIVAYLGPKGTFTEVAALKHFGQSVHRVPHTEISDVFNEVAAGLCHYGVVPIENSSEGAVKETLDLLTQMDKCMYICGEVELRIHQHLLSKETTLNAIKCLYSHAQSFAQCRTWLNTHLPGVMRIPLGSNAEAAKRASSEKRVAAVAGDIAAHHYNLPILASNIENVANNTTRFLIIGGKPVPSSEKDKTSLLFSTPNKVGALQKILEIFAKQQINMTRIESYPSRVKMWDYVFFVDVEGHVEDEKLKEVLAHLQEATPMFRHLGSYPQALPTSCI